VLTTRFGNESGVAEALGRRAERRWSAPGDGGGACWPPVWATTRPRHILPAAQISFEPLRPHPTSVIRKGRSASSGTRLRRRSLNSALPDDRKRVGNKILAAKAPDLLQRIRERDDELQLSGMSRYELLRGFRYESNVLEAISSTVAAIQPFRSMPPRAKPDGPAEADPGSP
jgi:hypothetical protein